MKFILLASLFLSATTALTPLSRVYTKWKLPARDRVAPISLTQFAYWDDPNGPGGIGILAAKLESDDGDASVTCTDPRDKSFEFMKRVADDGSTTAGSSVQKKEKEKKNRLRCLRAAWVVRVKPSWRGLRLEIVFAKRIEKTILVYKGTISLPRLKSQSCPIRAGAWAHLSGDQQCMALREPIKKTLSFHRRIRVNMGS